MLADFVQSVHNCSISSPPTECNDTGLNSVDFGGYTQRLWILWHLSEDGSSVGVRLPSFARIVLSALYSHHPSAPYPHHPSNERWPIAKMYPYSEQNNWELRGHTQWSVDVSTEGKNKFQGIK